MNHDEPSFDESASGAAVMALPSRTQTAWLSRALSRVSTDETVILIALGALCVVVRTLWLTPVEIWGDAGQKWHFARQLAYDNDFRHVDWSHHMARFGVNIPVFLLQRVLGTAAKFYYVVPVGAYTAQVLLLYLVGRRLAGRSAGVVAALVGIFFTGTIRSSSQLLPDGIAGSVLMGSCYCLLRFYEAEGAARLRWLLAVGVSFAWVYAIKESNLLLFPGLLSCVWLGRRSLKEASIFAAVLAAYGALETAGFWLFTKYWSRFAIAQEAPEYRPIHFWQLFDRFVRLESSWQMLLLLWLPSALWLAAKRDKAFRPALILPASFLFFLTFMVRHVDPLVPWIGNKSRYLAVIAPFLVLGITLLFTELSRGVWNVYRHRSLERVVTWAKREAGLAVMVVCALLGFGTWLSEWGGQRAQRELWHQARVLNDAYRRNLPIIDYTRGARGLKTAYEVHLNDAYLAQADLAPKGCLPDPDDVLRVITSERGRLNYLLANAGPYGAGELERLIANKCAVTVVTHDSSIRLKPNDVLPATCVAPGGELQPF
jgi:hypothetical protein